MKGVEGLFKDKPQMKGVKGLIQGSAPNERGGGPYLKDIGFIKVCKNLSKATYIYYLLS